jgi:hypothetical protein
VNFLAHDVVLPADASAVLRVAVAVPDLWSLLPKRPLPATIRAATQASPDPAVRAVGQGVSAHLRADMTFHRHPEFLRRVAWLDGELREVWPSLGSTELGAHIMVEMLLDRWLLRGEPNLVERYFASFQKTHIAFVSSVVATDRESQDVLARVLESFTASRFLADYAHPHLLVTRFAGRLERLRFASANNPPIDQLESRIKVWGSALECGSSELLEAVRQVVRTCIEVKGHGDVDAGTLTGADGRSGRL